jgi:hypothetical protein
MNIQLRKFDISSIPDDKVVVLIGKRETGKSFLLKDLLYHHRDIPIGTVVSPTESANTFFGDMVPPIFIHDDYTPAVLQNVVKRQKIMMRKIAQHKKVYGNSNIDPRAFLVLDDCMYDGSWTKDVNVRLLFMNGRHYKLMFLITMQHPLGIPPSLRTNIDYVFILRENLVSNRKKIYDNYAGMFPTFDFFCQVLDQTTENFECLVINNNAKTNRLEEQVFWYKAEGHDDFRVGAREFWALSKECDEEVEEDEDGYDPTAVQKTKRGPVVSVKKASY